MGGEQKPVFSDADKFFWGSLQPPGVMQAHVSEKNSSDAEFFLGAADRGSELRLLEILETAESCNPRVPCGGENNLF